MNSSVSKGAKLELEDQLDETMTAGTQELRACPHCATTTGDRLDYAPAPWDLRACHGCGFVYLRNPPDYVELEEDYAWEKTYAEKKKKSPGSTFFSPANRWLRAKLKLVARDRSKAFQRWFGNGKVLDVGCADGTMLPDHVVPFGIELSRQLHAAADTRMRERGGYCVHGAGAEGIYEFEENQFDGITMRSYLEHETDPMKVLLGAARALKPGGVIFVRVPNYGSLNRRFLGSKWCGFRHPDHVNYFTLSSLRKMAAKAGFDVEVTNNIALPVDDNINALLRPVAT